VNQDNWSGNNLMIPYEIDSSFSTGDKNKIIESMDGMTELMGGCIEFKHDSGGMYPNGGVQFKNNQSGCWSYIGQITTSGRQTIHLGSGCVHQMIIEHEFLHALGIYHEQSRPDRDDWIVIHWDNIQSNYHSQYSAISSSGWANQNVDYDKESVMHYPWYGFLTSEASQQGLSAMTDKETGAYVQKPRQPRMTGLDAIQLQKMYDNFCAPLKIDYCADGAPYLCVNKCDGHGDCAFGDGDNDNSDEVDCGSCGDPVTTQPTTTTTTESTTTTMPPTSPGGCSGVTIKALKVPNGKIKPNLKYPMGGISKRSMIVRYNLLMTNLWKKEYLGYLSFSRNVCGSDFIMKMADNMLNLDIHDKTQCYTLNTRSAVSSFGVTFQFHHHTAPADIKMDYGTNKRDQLYFVINGIDSVKWGSKKAKNCLEKAKIHVISNAAQVGDGSANYASCVAEIFDQ
jgi:hypothetical protein